ncbi:MAG: thiamine phosphate synthase [Acidimicrobiales bacterium]
MAEQGVLAGRRLYLCTGDRPDLADFLAACIAGGVDVVQLRDKVLDARPLLERAIVAWRVCTERGVPFILNDRPDLALACQADGVHLGQDDAPPGLARRVLGAGVIVGLSTHSPEQWDAASREPVDYLSAGPVRATPTKPGRPGVGLGYLRHVSSTPLGREVPWFVTGGVTPEAVPDMAEAGARRFVVVRYLTGAADPESAARRLRAAIDDSAAWG